LLIRALGNDPFLIAECLAQPALGWTEWGQASILDRLRLVYAA